MQGREIADQKYTIEHYLKRSNRDKLPLDRRFVQSRDENNRPGPGPLGEFVRRSRETALDQYLWLHAVASNENEGRFDLRLPAATWARATGGYFDPQTGVVEPAALHAVSRNWLFLQQLRLIDRQRVGRRARVWLLADDGSGEPYEHPGEGAEGKSLEDAPGYIQLPYAYWYDQWYQHLSLAAKAVLLISLAAGDGFALPYAKFPIWYGLSASTGERGLSELRERHVLHRERHRRPDTESPVGFSDVYHYELLPPFGPRKVLSKSAPPQWIGPVKVSKKQRSRRSAKTTGKTGTPSHSQRRSSR